MKNKKKKINKKKERKKKEKEKRRNKKGNEEKKKEGRKNTALPGIFVFLMKMKNMPAEKKKSTHAFVS